MTKTEAFKIDTEFYADLDESGLYCVFGNESGFAYGSFADEGEAKNYATEMNEAR